MVPQLLAGTGCALVTLPRSACAYLLASLSVVAPADCCCFSCVVYVCCCCGTQGPSVRAASYPSLAEGRLQPIARSSRRARGHVATAAATTADGDDFIAGSTNSTSNSTTGNSTTLVQPSNSESVVTSTAAAAAMDVAACPPANPCLVSPKRGGGRGGRKAELLRSSSCRLAAPHTRACDSKSSC